MGQEENAGNQYFLLLPQSFLYIYKQLLLQTITIAEAELTMSSINTLNLDKYVFFVWLSLKAQNICSQAKIEGIKLQ